MYAHVTLCRTTPRAEVVMLFDQKAKDLLGSDLQDTLEGKCALVFVDARCSE